MIIKDFVRKNIEVTTASIKFFSEQPLDSLGQIFPMGMVCTSIIGFVVAIISFVVSGGFSAQIDAFKEGVLDGIIKGFTVGTVNILISGIVSGIILFLLLAETIVLMVSYFKTESTAKKIVVCGCLVIGPVLISIPTILLAIGFGKIGIPKELETRIAERLSDFEKGEIDIIVNCLNIITVLGIVILIMVVILLLVSEHRWMIKNSVIALLITHVILPSSLLLIENAIPMFIGIIVLTIICVALLLGFKILLSDDDEVQASDPVDNSNTSAPNKTTTTPPVKEVKILSKNYTDNDKFYRDRGGMGIAVPQGETGICIYVDRAGYTANKHEFVCTAYQYDKGNVIIRTNSGRDIRI